MKKYISMVLSVVMALAFGACSKDNPFDNELSSATGGLRTTGMNISLNSEYGPRPLNGRVRAKAPAVTEFDVTFINEETGMEVRSFKYAEMPEIVTLPVGSYTVRASYGENPVAEWESPYYMGEAKQVEIKKDEITEDVDPITCVFANIRVSVDFAPDLQKLMGADCKVEVKVGDRGSLPFTLSDVNRSGYFKFVDNSETLAAEFTGTVDRVFTTESQAFNNVKPGTHYKIYFKIHDAGEDEPGDIVPDGSDSFIDIDATVTSSDMNMDVDFDAPEGEASDGDRPHEDWNDPGTGDHPGGEDPTGGSAPKIVGLNQINLDGVNVLPNDEDTYYPVAIKITSEAPAGIESFTVKVNMAEVSDDDLIELGLAPQMDLVHPSPAYVEKLKNLGFPVEKEVEGQHEVSFDITDLMSLLKALGEGTHYFTLTVGDAYGTTTKTLTIKYAPN